MGRNGRFPGRFFRADFLWIFGVPLTNEKPPHGPQDGLEIDLESILRGFDVRTLKRTIRPVCPLRVSRLGGGKVGLWEEVRAEGNPSTHRV